MHWEFDLVWPHLSPGGVILADDVNHGWLAFAEAVGQVDTARSNVRRFAGIRKPPGADPDAPARSSTTTAAGAS
jgi:predicted O-methyltransferase YrrM